MAITDQTAADTLMTLDGDLQRSSQTKHVSPLALATFLFVTTFMAAFGWVSIAGNPRGGEPMAILPIALGQSGESGPEAESLLANGKPFLLNIPTPWRKPAEAAEGQIETVGVGDDMPWSTPDDLAHLRDEGGLEEGVVELPDEGETLDLANADPYDSWDTPPVANDGRPQIAILVRGMGLNQSTTRLAIDLLPDAVALSFVPYSKKLPSWADEARAAGHELLIELPMEPYDYPDNDPGPYTLLSNVSAEQNLERLDWLLERFDGYVGVTNYLGAKFLANSDAMRPILEAIRSRGLLYLDDGSGPERVIQGLGNEVGVAWAVSDHTLTYTSGSAVDLDLSTAEQTARQSGLALVTGFAFPVTVRRVAAWAETLEDRGIQLVPLSTVVGRPSQS